MKTKLYSVIILFAFFALAALPNSFAQTDLSRPSVRLVYFLPNDRSARPERVSALRKMAKDVQQFYADEMERHGYGRKTFSIETNKRGEPVVHRVDGKFNEDYYYDPLTEDKIFEEISERFDDIQHVYFITIDLRHEALANGNACGFATLVLCHRLSDGYNLLSLMRASCVVNRQLTVARC